MKSELQAIEIGALCPKLFRIKSGKLTWYKNYVAGGAGGPSPFGYEVDPTDNLDAMHEVEKTLDANEFHVYRQLLIGLCQMAYRKNDDSPHCVHPECASAAIRAEAFLRTKGRYSNIEKP